VQFAALSLQVPSEARVASRPGGLRIEAARFWLDIRIGPAVQDLDDGEPAVCYTSETLMLADRRATLRIARPSPRLDCPERYASLYLAPRAGDAVYLMGQGSSYEDLALLREIVATIRLDN
jgi:hypothetical protein